MRRVIWSESSLRDLGRVQDFLIRENPLAAVEAVSRIEASAAHLAEFPAIGHAMERRPLIREWIIEFGHGSYVLRYRLTTDGNAYILRVFHSREARH